MLPDPAFLRAFAGAVRPPERLGIPEWAAKHRMVAAESGSPEPGRWRNETMPHLVDVMRALEFGDPHETVVFMKSAQVGGTECGVNLFGWMLQQEPSPILIVLPTVDQALLYNRAKLGPAIDATPAMHERVTEQVSRDETGSTSLFKRFRGGFANITGANSSAGLQMISARIIVFEEVSEYPMDAGGRGEPTTQALARSKGFEAKGRKLFFNSTPAIVGQCRITDLFDKSDQRRRYVPCPHCGHYQVLTWPRLRWASDTAPHGAYFECAANGCVIEAHDKPRMLAAGQWIRAYPGDDAPGESFPPEDLARYQARLPRGSVAGFAIWQAYSPLVRWDATVAEYFAALGDARKLKVFTQQALGLAWEERGDAPDHEKLMERRESWPANRLPPGVLFTTMGVDVQKDRLEWAVYGWGRDLSGWLVDRGIIMGETEADAVWAELDRQIARRYRDAWGRDWPIDAVGIDAGYLSQRVYRHVASYGRSSRVKALDGRPGWKLPALGKAVPKGIDYQGRTIGSVALWPVGTWDLKSELYSRLRATLRGPDADGRWSAGALHFPADCDPTFFQQLTAEALVDRRNRRGYTEKEWTRQRDRNEQLDLAVYALALARHETEPMADEDWDALVLARMPPKETVQPDFADLWKQAAAQPSASPAAEAGPVEPVQAEAPEESEADEAAPAMPAWMQGMAQRRASLMGRYFR